jgi:hypothetical protein
LKTILAQLWYPEFPNSRVWGGEPARFAKPAKDGIGKEKYVGPSTFIVGSTAVVLVQTCKLLHDRGFKHTLARVEKLQGEVVVLRRGPW